MRLFPPFLESIGEIVGVGRVVATDPSIFDRRVGWHRNYS
jgi:hypothetical protein